MVGMHKKRSARSISVAARYHYVSHIPPFDILGLETGKTRQEKSTFCRLKVIKARNASRGKPGKKLHVKRRAVYIY